MNPIETAVAPLRTDAIARAEKDATDLVTKMLAELAAADWNLDTVAPRPRTDIRREDYKRMMRNRERYATITVTDLRGKFSSRMGDPSFVKADASRSAAFIERCKFAAGIQYDAFVTKLTGKVGEVLTAELAGNHIWGRSTLTVTKANGTTERWLTQQIVNVSVLGLLFNQWPTRKVK